MNSPIIAGLISAIPLACILVIYTLVRGKALVAFFQGQDESIAKFSAKTMFWIILAGFIGIAFVFGALSGLVYIWLGMPRYQYLAFGATALFCLLALVSKQPLKGDKIFWNLAIGITLGVLVPLLAG
jgi:hypothetical protein